MRRVLDYLSITFVYKLLLLSYEDIISSLAIDMALFIIPLAQELCSLRRVMEICLSPT